MSNTHLLSLFSPEKILKRTYFKLLTYLGDTDAQDEFWDDRAERHIIPLGAIREKAEQNQLLEGITKFVLEGIPLPDSIPADIRAKATELKELYHDPEENAAEKTSLKKRMEEYQAGHLYGGRRRTRTRKEKRKRRGRGRGKQLRRNRSYRRH